MNLVHLFKLLQSNYSFRDGREISVQFDSNYFLFLQSIFYSHSRATGFKNNEVKMKKNILKSDTCLFSVP